MFQYLDIDVPVNFNGLLAVIFAALVFVNRISPVDVKPFDVRLTVGSNDKTLELLSSKGELAVIIFCLVSKVVYKGTVFI